MFPRRFAIIAVVAVLVIALFVVPGIQRDSWLQGYLAGQASQDGGKVAPAAPYLYPGYGGYGGPGYGPHFPGFGFLILLGLGLFFFCGIGRRLMYHAWRQGEGPEGFARRHGYRHGDYRHAPWWSGEDEPGDPYRDQRQERRAEPGAEAGPESGDRPAGRA